MPQGRHSQTPADATCCSRRRVFVPASLNLSRVRIWQPLNPAQSQTSPCSSSSTLGPSNIHWHKGTAPTYDVGHLETFGSPGKDLTVRWPNPHRYAGAGHEMAARLTGFTAEYHPQASQTCLHRPDCRHPSGSGYTVSITTISTDEGAGPVVRSHHVLQCSRPRLPSSRILEIVPPSLRAETQARPKLNSDSKTAPACWMVLDQLLVSTETRSSRPTSIVSIPGIDSRSRKLDGISNGPQSRNQSMPKV